MYDFSELRPTNKEIAFAVLIVFALLVAVFGCGYMLGLRNAGTGVSDNGIGINTAREQLSSAAESQHEMTAGVNSAKEGAARIEGGIQQISKSAERSAAAVSETGNLISDCQQIIGRVRNRGQKGTLEN